MKPATETTYLSSLEQSGSPKAAEAATAPAPDLLHSAKTRTGTAPTSSAGMASTEDRKSPRYRCKGSARLRESGSDVTIWATFADISMHGCYVEAASPLPVGAVLGLQLEWKVSGSMPRERCVWSIRAL